MVGGNAEPEGGGWRPVISVNGLLFLKQGAFDPATPGRTIAPRAQCAWVLATGWV